MDALHDVIGVKEGRGIYMYNIIYICYCVLEVTAKGGESTRGNEITYIYIEEVVALC